MKETSKAPLFLKTKKVTKGLKRNIKATRNEMVKRRDMAWFENFIWRSSI